MAVPRYGSELSGTTEVSNSESHSCKAKVSSSKGSKVKLYGSKAKVCLSKHKHRNHSKHHKAEKNNSTYHKTEKNHSKHHKVEKNKPV